jgi:hypothetical protein
MVPEVRIYRILSDRIGWWTCRVIGSFSRNGFQEPLAEGNGDPYTESFAGCTTAGSSASHIHLTLDISLARFGLRTHTNPDGLDYRRGTGSRTYKRGKSPSKKKKKENYTRELDQRDWGVPRHSDNDFKTISQPRHRRPEKLLTSRSTPSRLS